MHPYFNPLIAKMFAKNDYLVEIKKVEPNIG